MVKRSAAGEKDSMAAVLKSKKQISFCQAFLKKTFLTAFLGSGAIKIIRL